MPSSLVGSSRISLVEDVLGVFGVRFCAVCGFWPFLNSVFGFWPFLFSVFGFWPFLFSVCGIQK